MLRCMRWQPSEYLTVSQVHAAQSPPSDEAATLHSQPFDVRYERRRSPTQRGEKMFIVTGFLRQQLRPKLASLY